MIKGAIVLLLCICLLTVPSKQQEAGPIDEQREKTMYAVRVLNATEIYEGSAVKVYTIINNPETWTLHNVTCWFLIKPFTDVKIVEALETENITVTYEAEGEEYANITIFIKRIGMSTRFAHWIALKFNRNGTYNILSYYNKRVVAIHGNRTKGELIEEFNMSINNASITVKKRPKPCPSEGTKNAYPIVVIATIIMPLTFVALSNKIGRRRP